MKKYQVHPVSLRKSVLGLYYTLAKGSRDNNPANGLFHAGCEGNKHLYPDRLVPFTSGVTLLVSGQINTQKCVVQYACRVKETGK